MQPNRVNGKTGVKQGRFFYGWVIVGVGMVVWVLEPGMFLSFGVFFKPISLEMGWTRAVVSGAISLNNMAVGLLAPFSGALADRYGARRLVMASGALTGLGYLLLSTTRTLWQFYAFHILVGLGMGIAFAPIVATVLRWFEKKRGLALGLTSVGTGVGGMVFPLLTNQLISLWGWRNSYLVLGILMGATVVLAATFLRTSPQEMGLRPYGAEGEWPETAPALAANPAPRTHFTLRQALATGPFWMVFFAAMAAVFSFMLVNVHLVPHATDQGLSRATAASAMAVIGASNGLGRLGLGALSDRTGRKRMFLFVLLLGGAAMLFLIGAQTAWMFFVFAFFFGLAYGGAQVTWLALPGELFGLGAVGAITGLLMTGNTFGGALGSFLAGYIFDITGSYSAAFSIGAILLLAGSGLVLFLKAPRRTAAHDIA